MAASSSEAQLKNEIERLTASINKHKSNISSQPSATGYPTFRANTYVNPNYKPANKYIRATATTAIAAATAPTPPSTNSSSQVKEVVLGGVAFQSSRRSLVRKDFSKPSATSSGNPTIETQPAPYGRKSGHLVSATRVYKPKSSRGRRGGPSNRNMTLNNRRRPYQARRTSNKRIKYSDKQCPRFSTTGSCSHGLTCMYQHDPSKIAICWNFLQDKCPNTADTCNLSHDPTPERTPLCLHFLNKGRCTRPNCPFPHVNVGARQGVCRDFAVLGYCDAGLDCDKQHVRECPDFAEKGTCSTKGCKLPHVIRANRNRKPTSTSVLSATTATLDVSSTTLDSSSSAGPEGDSRVPRLTADDAQLGDEYISLTFNESESEEESDDDADDDSEDDNEEDEEEEVDEGDDPDDVADEVPVVG